ncbi:MAG: hypothetical protein ACOYL5_20350 [Phototrophicaceae bacterium]
MTSQPRLRRRTIPLWQVAFGCVVALGVGVSLLVIALALGILLFRDRIVGLGLQSGGFEPIGQTEALFAENAVTPIPTPILFAPLAPTQFSVQLGNSQQTFDTATAGVTVQVGSEPSGAQAATVQVDESGLLRLCNELSTLCSPAGYSSETVSIRNVTGDLKQGGLILYGDIEQANLPGLSQQIGIVMQVDSSGQRLAVRGVDVGGILYSAPPDGLGELVAEAERTANETIQQLAVSAGGGQYNVSQLAIDETTLTVILR